MGESFEDACTNTTCYSNRHGFKYRPILIYVGNIISDFEIPDMIGTDMADIAYIADIDHKNYWLRRMPKF